MKYKPILVIKFRDFKNMILKEHPQAVADRLREWQKAATDLAEYPWDNNAVRVSDTFGNEFGVGIYGDTLHFYTITGICIKTDVHITVDGLNDALERMELFTTGSVHCRDSSCDKIVPYHEARHNRYWAGIYCQDCWDRLYHRMAQQESTE